MGQSSSDPELFFVKKQKVNWKKKNAVCTNLAISVLEIRPRYNPKTRNGSTSSSWNSET